MNELLDLFLALGVMSCYVLGASVLAHIGMYVFKRKYGYDLFSDEDDD